MYIPAASMGEYDSYKAPAPRKKPPGTLERTDSRRTVERSDSRGALGRQSSKGELVRSSSRSQLNRAASQSYLRNYSPVPMEEELKGSDSRRGSRCAGNHNASEQRGGALWNSMQGKEVKREDSKLKRQESRNGGIQRQDSQRGFQRQDSRTGSLQRQDSRTGGSLQRQDSRSNGVKYSPKEREPYQGGNNWKDSLRGASPTKPVWERSTASSRAKQSNGEAYVPRKTSTARNNSSARRSRSDSVTRRSRSQSGSPDRLMRPTYSSRAKGRRASRNSMGSPPRSRTSSVSPSRAQSSSNRAQSSSPSRRPSRRASSSETPFTGGSTIRGKPGDGGNPIDKYVPFDQFRASRGQDSYSAKASTSSYTAAATSYSSSAIRNDARSGGGTSPIRSPTRSSTSPIRLPSSSPTRRPSSSPIRNPSDSAWRNSTSSNYAKLSTSSSTSATGSSWQAKTSNSSFSASKAIDSSDSYSFSSKAADSSYGSWGRNSGRGTSTSPKSSFSTSRSPGGSSGRIGLSALKKPVIEPWEDERKDSSSSTRRGVSSTYIG